MATSQGSEPRGNRNPKALGTSDHCGRQGEKGRCTLRHSIGSCVVIALRNEGNGGRLSTASGAPYGREPPCDAVYESTEEDRPIVAVPQRGQGMGAASGAMPAVPSWGNSSKEGSREFCESVPRGLRGRRGAEVPESEGGAGELRQLHNESGVVGLAEVVRAWSRCHGVGSVGRGRAASPAR